MKDPLKPSTEGYSQHRYNDRIHTDKSYDADREMEHHDRHRAYEQPSHRDRDSQPRSDIWPHDRQQDQEHQKTEQPPSRNHRSRSGGRGRGDRDRRSRHQDRRRGDRDRDVKSSRREYYSDHSRDRSAHDSAHDSQSIRRQEHNDVAPIKRQKAHHPVEEGHFSPLEEPSLAPQPIITAPVNDDVDEEFAMAAAAVEEEEPPTILQRIERMAGLRSKLSGNVSSVSVTGSFLVDHNVPTPAEDLPVAMRETLNMIPRANPELPTRSSPAYELIPMHSKGPKRSIWDLNTAIGRAGLLINTHDTLLVGRDSIAEEQDKARRRMEALLLSKAREKARKGEEHDYKTVMYSQPKTIKSPPTLSIRRTISLKDYKSSRAKQGKGGDDTDTVKEKEEVVEVEIEVKKKRIIRR